MLSLCDPILSIEGLGCKTSQRLNQLGIYTLEHMLFHLPIRYQDKTFITPISKAQDGSEALIEMEIERTEEKYGHRKQLICHLTNGHKKLILRFFHFNQYQKQNLIRGEKIQCFGEIRIGRESLEMHHPEYRIISKQNPLLETTLTPIYSICAGINQNKMKQWMNEVINILDKKNIKDHFAKILTNNMPNLKEALLLLHRPKKNENLEQIKQNSHIAQIRLIIDELTAHQLELKRAKLKRKLKISNIFNIDKTLCKKLLESLNFNLTQAQIRCIKEINKDLSSNKPMLRLLQGDVGSGKTIIAVFALLQAVSNGFQTAIMAPTEILAKQHQKSFSQYLHKLEINIAFLSGSQKNKEREAELAKIKSGEAQIIIGTQALFQEKISFANLGFVVIDEQHKFGVHQRLLLTQKAKKIPHQLVMTATPIPRSLTMSAYADLDTSIVDELPLGRKPIDTITISNSRKQEIINRIKTFCKNGKQVYWVCTLIEESESLRAESAQNSFIYLKENLPELNIFLIHGRLDKKEKENIMQDFTKGKIDVLIATTVIEVGVNIPNANLMIVENAERLGLAQLHQLRGRVGRSSDKSFCVLMYQPPLSKMAKERINILRQTCDGFLIAQKDLELRGPGEVLGTQQTGVASMRIANIVRDEHLIKQASYYSEMMLNANEKEQRSLINRWLTIDIPDYANA